MMNQRRFSRHFLQTLLVAMGVAIVPLAVLYAFNVPLGQPDKLIYRYSEVIRTRAQQLGPLGAVCMPLAAGIWLAASRKRGRPVIGVGLGLVGIALLLVWNFWAPPGEFLIHAFNYSSPSHDGAFVIETGHARDIPAYLRQFDQRLKRSKEEMKSTRVIGNPPGTTVYLAEILQTFPPTLRPELGWRERVFVDLDMPAVIPRLSVALTAALGMAALSVLAIFPVFGLGREFFSAPASLLFTVVVLFNPSTAHFFPGKDPAQLLTVCAMLWAGLAGYRRGSWLYSAIGGALLPLGTSLGLIHLWIAIAMSIGVMWDAWRSGRPRQCLTRSIIPAAVGAIAVMLIVYLSIGWNMPLTFWQAQVRFRELQPELGFNRGLWMVIGLPLFLLFLGPMPYLLGLINFRRGTWRRPGLGQRLLISTLAVMLLTYLLGISYELSRLWVVFIPLLMLGLMIPRTIFSGSHVPRRVILGLILATVAHVLVTGVHWSFLDAREAEYRVRSGRMFN